jgi:uncharacterized membrane protein
VILSRFYRLSAVALMTELAVAAWGLLQVGPSASVPIHWNVNGDPDGWAPAWLAFSLGPAITLLVVGLMALVPRIEPRRANLRRSANAYRTVAVALVLFLVVVQVVTVAQGVGYAVPVGLVISFGIGLLFVVIGNVLGTVRSNFMFGVRTPWTLSSDRSWDRTHRLVGRLFVVTGVVVAISSLAGQLALTLGLLLVMISVTLVGGTWYSYREWQADPDRRPAGDPG